jgi:hypothetical protein
MSLLPATASFEELVQDCFLSHRGAGLMLSALDAELVGHWAREEVPFEVVARGIRRAAEKALWDSRPGEPVLRSLRACKREVEAEIKKYRSRSAGKSSPFSGQGEGQGEGGPQSPRRSIEEERHARIRSVLTKLGKEVPRVQPTLSRLLSGPLAGPPADLARADRNEDLACAALARALPFPERLALLKEARSLEGSPSASSHARKLSGRFHRQALVRRALNLPSFW